MKDLILHHYAGSPFAEKARLMLGFKGLSWASVDIPVVMPKPDVVALTGGFRKTPLLQRGADIYCDTALIARVLEDAQPTLFPASAPLAPVLAQWADSTLFWTVVPYTFQPAGTAYLYADMPPEALKSFAADRAPFSAGVKRLNLADATVNLTAYLAALEGQLSDGRRWLFGVDASIADFSVVHCLWFVHRVPPIRSIFAAAPRVLAWLERVLAIGHGTPTPLSSADAVNVAAATSNHAATSVQAGLGFEAGQAVTVAATDYGTEPAAGTLIGLNEYEVVLRRVDPRAGTVHVHFPRFGYQIKKEQT